MSPHFVDSLGGLRGILASDVTELKRAQAELEDLAEYLKRETGTDVSHGLCPDCFERRMNGLDGKGTKTGGAG